LPGKLFEIVLAESAAVFTILVFIQEIMVFPKGILFGSALAGFSGPLRFLPQEGEMNISQPDFAGLNVLFFDLTPRASGESPAVRSLEIAKLDQCHRCIWITAEMPGLRHQIGHQRFIPGVRL